MMWWFIVAYWRMVGAMCQPLPTLEGEKSEQDQRLDVLDATAYTFAQLSALLEKVHYVVGSTGEREAVARIQRGLAVGQRDFLASRHRTLLQDVPVHLSAD